MRFIFSLSGSLIINFKYHTISAIMGSLYLSVSPSISPPISTISSLCSHWIFRFDGLQPRLELTLQMFSWR